MPSRHSGTAVILEFSSCPALSFLQISQAFEARMRTFGAGQGQVTWDGDDIVILDQGALRVALGWIKPGRRKASWYLVIAIGPSPEGAVRHFDTTEWETLAERIVAQVARYLAFDNVMRCHISSAIDPNLIDLISELILSNGTGDPEVSEVQAKSPEGAAQRETLGKGASKSRASRPPQLFKKGRAIDTNAPKSAPRPDPISDEDRIRQLRAILTGTDARTTNGKPADLLLYALGFTTIMPQTERAISFFGMLREQVASLT